MKGLNPPPLESSLHSIILNRVSGKPWIQPKRRPGANIFENDPKEYTSPLRAKTANGGGGGAV